MNMAVEKFVNDIKNIHEYDYGDFMRAANHCLIDLKHEMDRLPYQDVHKKLQEMQGYIQFNPNWDVDSTFEKALKDALSLETLLQAHRQDWES